MTESVEDQVAVPVGEGAGAMLRRERESQGLSVFDVARALRLSEKQITALENDDYARLPGRTFVRGFIRNYARLVQLDPELLMAHLFFSDAEESHQIQVPSQKISFSEHESRPWLKWLMMAFVVVAVASWGVLQWLGPEQVSLPRKSEPVALPSRAPVAVLPAVPATEIQPVMPAVTEPAVQPVEPLTTPALARLNMTFTGRAWVEVRDKAGNIIHSQNNTAGTEQVVEGEPPLSLVIGSAPNVKLIYRGKAVDLSAFTKTDVARLTLE